MITGSRNLFILRPFGPPPLLAPPPRRAQTTSHATIVDTPMHVCVPDLGYGNRARRPLLALARSKRSRRSDGALVPRSRVFVLRSSLSVLVSGLWEFGETLWCLIGSILMERRLI